MYHQAASVSNAGCRRRRRRSPPSPAPGLDAAGHRCAGWRSVPCSRRPAPPPCPTAPTPPRDRRPAASLAQPLHPPGWPLACSRCTSLCPRIGATPAERVPWAPTTRGVADMPPFVVTLAAFRSTKVARLIRCVKSGPPKAMDHVPRLQDEGNRHAIRRGTHRQAQFVGRETTCLPPALPAYLLATVIYAAARHLAHAFTSQYPSTSCGLRGGVRVRAVRAVDAAAFPSPPPLRRSRGRKKLAMRQRCNTLLRSAMGARKTGWQIVA